MAGIPRLQELTFLEQAARAVHEDSTFEDMRRRLIAHMSALRSDYDGSGNQAGYRLAMDSPGRYVRNVSESLKELMRLEYVVRAPVPATKRSAQAYVNTRFSLTDRGDAWLSQLATDPRSGYDALFSDLWRLHPQFSGFVQATSDGLVVPLAGWREAVGPDLPIEEAREQYVSYLTRRYTHATQDGHLGWSAEPGEVTEYLNSYLDDRYEAARRRNRPDPYPRSRDFVNACEEAMVKFALTRAGCEIDYISHEILRRWTSFFGVTNFSYHVPGFQALRLWSSATIDLREGGARPRRPNNRDLAPRIIEALPTAFEDIRRGDSAISMYVPVYRLRAAVSWRLRTSDSAFDQAIRGFLGSDDLQRRAGYRLHLDAAMYGSVPPTERPIRIETSSGTTKRFYTVGIVPLDERTSL